VNVAHWLERVAAARASIAAGDEAMPEVDALLAEVHAAAESIPEAEREAVLVAIAELEATLEDGLVGVLGALRQSADGGRAVRAYQLPEPSMVEQRLSRRY
jgi:hypothetical protein